MFVLAHRVRVEQVDKKSSRAPKPSPSWQMVERGKSGGLKLTKRLKLRRIEATTVTSRKQQHSLVAYGATAGLTTRRVSPSSTAMSRRLPTYHTMQRSPKDMQLCSCWELLWKILWLFEGVQEKVKFGSGRNFVAAPGVGPGARAAFAAMGYAKLGWGGQPAAGRRDVGFGFRVQHPRQVRLSTAITNKPFARNLLIL